MSKVPTKHVELVRMAQADATDSMVLSIVEGGHLSEPALKSVALMLGIGMDEVIKMVEKYKEEQANALHVPGRPGDEAGTAGDAVRPDP